MATNETPVFPGDAFKCAANAARVTDAELRCLRDAWLDITVAYRG